MTFDSDGDGRPEYAPFTFPGTTQSGSKYPPVVGNDGVLYTDTATRATADLWTPLGALVGWKVGTRHISRVMDWGAKKRAGRRRTDGVFHRGPPGLLVALLRP